jgi:beta-carotene 3-hydroxylase
MSVLAACAIVIATVLAMEWVAWASHKYIMHGWGWGWHRDHHEPHDNCPSRKNDQYAIVGAAMSISMFAIGSPIDPGANAAWAPGTWIGLGILFYGIIYTAVHDGLVHQRWFRWVPQAAAMPSGWCRRTSCTMRPSARKAGSASASCSRGIRPC